MEKYLGVKLISAKPMNLGDYNKFKGWTIPEDEDPTREGYQVMYSDDYISWSPKEAFDKAYRRIDYLTFGLAIEALKKGFKIARKGWNGKGMFIVMMGALYLPPYITQGTERKVNDRTAKWIGIDKPLDSQPYIAMFTALGQWQPGWNASQADIFAEDWQIVD
jgi:hypothetical protein